jgi:hypothetical protein
MKLRIDVDVNVGNPLWPGSVKWNGIGPCDKAGPRAFNGPRPGFKNARDFLILI